MSKYVVAMYIRLSVEDTKTDSLSISNQRLLIGRYIDAMEQMDMEVLEFIDNGYSGVNFERPAMQELLELVKQSKLNCIIVKDFSRFGRNSIETAYFMERIFPIYGTRFISIGDNYDSNDYKGGTGGIQVAFKYLMHEYYSQDLSRKEKSAKYAKMKRGEYQSVVCNYGYYKGANGKLEIDEEAAEVVRLIFHLALKIKNAQKIVEALYERKIPTPGEYKAIRGKSGHDLSRCNGIWQRSTILRILEDERYIGTYIMGKRTVNEIGGRANKLKNENEWFKIPNHHSAIISKELYEQVQAKLLRFKCVKHEKQYPLRGKIYCGCCQHAMHRSNNKGHDYSCRYTSVDKTADCNGMIVGERDLETLLFDVISKQAQVILSLDNLSDLSNLELQSAQQTEYDKQIAQYNESKRNIYERFVLHEIGGAEYKTLKSAIDADLYKAERSRNAISEELKKMRAHADIDVKSKEIAEGVSTEAGLSQEIVDLLIQKVMVYPDNHVEIIWKVSAFDNHKE